MKATNFLISTLRDAPNDAVIASHQLMMKSGMLRKLGNGLYSYMPMGLRSFNKVTKNHIINISKNNNFRYFSS